MNGIEVMDSNINIVGGQNFSNETELLKHEMFVAKLKIFVAIVLILVTIAGFFIPRNNIIPNSGLGEGHDQMVSGADIMSSLSSIGGRSVAEFFYQSYGISLKGEADMISYLGRQSKDILKSMGYVYNLILAVLLVFGIYLLLVSINKNKSLKKILKNISNNISANMVTDDSSVAVGSGVADFGQLPEI